MVCDAGFAVALVTHEIPRIGALIWVAQPTFDEEPTVDEVRAIDRWRWCFFPVAAALRRRLITPIGHVDVPKPLRRFPTMRSGNKRAGWRMIKFEDGRSRPPASRDRPVRPHLPDRQRHGIEGDDRLGMETRRRVVS